MGPKVVKDGLPAGLLLLHGMGRFAVKGNANHDAVRDLAEVDFSPAAVHVVGDALVLANLGVGALEVEAHGAVFGLHAATEHSSNTQIDSGRRGVPIIRCRIPLLDVLRRVVPAPDFFERSLDRGFNADARGISRRVRLRGGAGTVVGVC